MQSEFIKAIKALEPFGWKMKIDYGKRDPNKPTVQLSNGKDWTLANYTLDWEKVNLPAITEESCSGHVTRPNSSAISCVDLLPFSVLEHVPMKFCVNVAWSIGLSEVG